MTQHKRPINDWIFRQIHTHNLVYNTCWEDPRCDRELLDLDEKSEVVMITSAGCNALEYLLDCPAAIHCIDMNPRQNALLDLKLAAFAAADHTHLFKLFGVGRHEDARGLYYDQLRAYLPAHSQAYWDKNLHFFNGKGLRNSFYHYGTSGVFAWMANNYIKTQRNLYQKICKLFEAGTLEQQASLYYDIEKKLLNPIIEWVINRHFTMCMVGVPRSQQLLFANNYARGAMGFIQECLRRVFAEQSLHDNYFWRLYFYGAYEYACSPSYLQQNHFNTLSDSVNRIETHTTTISRFLYDNPGHYTHFVLLDHQDWLAANNRRALAEEWSLILANSAPGAKILLRSAAAEVNFFPDFVLDKVEFEKEKTVDIHRRDRVGTYASVYLGIVK